MSVKPSRREPEGFCILRRRREIFFRSVVILFIYSINPTNGLAFCCRCGILCPWDVPRETGEIMDEESEHRLAVHLEALNKFLQARFIEIEHEFKTRVRCIIIVEEFHHGDGKENPVQ